MLVYSLIQSKFIANVHENMETQAKLDMAGRGIGYDLIVWCKI